MDHYMTNDEWQTFNHDTKKFKSLGNSRYYCYCGHSVIINPPEERVLCTHCGYWVYKDKRKQNRNVKKIQLEEQKKLEKKKVEYFRKRLRSYINENTIK